MAFFLKYIHQLQRLLFETKTAKRGVLDILKTPESDPSLGLLCQHLNLRLDRTSSLFDLVLQYLLDYVTSLQRHPEVFELEESGQKDFNKWKQEVLQNVCLMLQQINVAANILVRKKPDEEQQAAYVRTFRFTTKTLEKLMSLLFNFEDPDEQQSPAKNYRQIHSLFLDSPPRTVQMISRVLSRVNQLPIRQSECQNLLVFEHKPSEAKQGVSIVQSSLSEILNRCLSSFTAFFSKGYRSFVTLDKTQRQELALIIKKMQYVISVSLSLAEHHLDNFQNVCQEECLQQVLGIVQTIIDNEQSYEAAAREDGRLIAHGSSSDPLKTGAGGNNFLYREEFTMIMQLIFSLTEYDLKYETDLRHETNESVIDVPPVNRPGRRSARESLRKQKEKGLTQVVFQSVDAIKGQYDGAAQTRETQVPPSGLAPVADELPDEQILQQTLSKYKQRRVQQLVKFFYGNKKLINRFICIN